MPIFKRYEEDDEITNMTDEIRPDAFLDFDKLSDEIVSSMNEKKSGDLIGANGRPIKHEMSILPENFDVLKHQSKPKTPEKPTVRETDEAVEETEKEIAPAKKTTADALLGRLLSAMEKTDKKARRTLSSKEKTSGNTAQDAPVSETTEVAAPDMTEVAAPDMTEVTAQDSPAPDTTEVASPETSEVASPDMTVVAAQDTPVSETTEVAAPDTSDEADTPQTLSETETNTPDTADLSGIASAEDTATDNKITDKTEIPSEPRIGKTDRLLSVNIDILTVLLPIVVWAVYVFGARALSVTAISVIFSVLSDYAIGYFRHRNPKLTDTTPMITGITVALFLPVTVPLWVPAVAALISGVFVRGFIRGYGDCRLDPVSSAICSVSILFPAAVGTLCKAFARLPAFSVSVPEFEKISETSLNILAGGNMPKDSLWACLFGLRSGAIGEISAILLIAAAIYLIVRKVIRPVLPLSFLLSFAILCYIFPRSIIESDAIAIEFTVYNLLTGNLLLAVIFAAAMPGVSPMTKGGAVSAGIIGGAATYAVRYLITGVYADALVAVLVISILSRPLDKLFIPAAFGGSSTRHKEKKKRTRKKTV